MFHVQDSVVHKRPDRFLLAGWALLRHQNLKGWNAVPVWRSRSGWIDDRCAEKFPEICLAKAEPNALCIEARAVKLREA